MLVAIVWQFYLFAFPIACCINIVNVIIIVNEQKFILFYRKSHFVARTKNNSGKRKFILNKNGNEVSKFNINENNTKNAKKKMLNYEKKNALK